MEELIFGKGWWDSVDAPVIHVPGVIPRHHPKEVDAWNTRWITSKDQWLDHAAILFQARCRKETDKALQLSTIERDAAHAGYFFRKAIGWLLRELAATGPEAVRGLASTHGLLLPSVHEAWRKW